MFLITSWLFHPRLPFVYIFRIVPNVSFETHESKLPLVQLLSLLDQSYLTEFMISQHRCSGISLLCSFSQNGCKFKAKQVGFLCARSLAVAITTHSQICLTLSINRRKSYALSILIPNCMKTPNSKRRRECVTILTHLFTLSRSFCLAKCFTALISGFAWLISKIWGASTALSADSSAPAARHACDKDLSDITVMCAKSSDSNYCCLSPRMNWVLVEHHWCASKTIKSHHPITELHSKPKLVQEHGRGRHKQYKVQKWLVAMHLYWHIRSGHSIRNHNKAKTAQSTDAEMKRYPITWWRSCNIWKKLYHFH